jgi:hypothetical protein
MKKNNPSLLRGYKKLINKKTVFKTKRIKKTIKTSNIKAIFLVSLMKNKEIKRKYWVIFTKDNWNVLNVK